MSRCAHAAAARRPGPAGGGRRVERLAVLGDSTAVGIGDPAAGGGWRGFPVLLRDALDAPPAIAGHATAGQAAAGRAAAGQTAGQTAGRTVGQTGADHTRREHPGTAGEPAPRTRLTNLARSGARMRRLRTEQLPAALGSSPDIAIVCAGMNDTLRSDFDPAALEADCAATLAALREAGALVVVLRYHDHTRVFRLPAPLRRALRTRIELLNAAIDAAADRAGATVLDLDALPGGYERSAWAVDRLHPSEFGHRLLAGALADVVAAAGWAVPEPVSPECSGGRRVTTTHRIACLVVKGLPWLVRRAGDLGPVIALGLVDGLRGGRTEP
nr:SGNH/GDSL hydrolase family protein [Pseudonocardia dioxanivorans]